MNQIALAPVFVLVAQTFILGFWLGGLRFRAVASREVRAKDIVLGQAAWPERITQVDRAFHNQLEMPLLFYALVAFVLFAQIANTTFVTMEWLYVVLRIVHAAIQVTTNHLRLRFLAFAASTFVLLVMWTWFAARLFIG